MALMMLAGCANQTVSNDTTSLSTLKQAQEAYLSKVDVDYSYDLAIQMEDISSNEQLGYRTAGSNAEFETGEMLKQEMEKIGLSNVSKDEFTLDGWEFDHARLTYNDLNNNEITIELGGYQTNFNTDGKKEYTLMDVNEGTMADLEGLDIEGKLLLININQRENWWINYPAYEAYLHNAAGVIAVQNGGYAQVSDDALNAQDICGPDYAPALSISVSDANKLREIMANNDTNELTVSLDVESSVIHDTTSYNIVGYIPGKSDDMVLMSAHYDSYFAGFQDDNAAIALMMGIAKGIIDSGYQPEKTLVFCAMAAEEWGVSNSRYDWSTGAYNQIFRVHPEWVGKVIADINFELPAMNEGDTDQIRSSYELKTYLESFKQDVPTVDNIFENGIEIIVPTQTWSDDFSLSIAGVPSTVTALRGGFAQTHYHSQFDNRDTYSKEAYLFHHNLYGMLMLAYDHMVVSPLDFSTRINALKEVCDKDILGEDNYNKLINKIDEALALADNAYQKVMEANDKYQKALDTKDENKINEVKEQYQKLNTLVLNTFKQCEDYFVRLTWEDVSQFPHEHSINNIINLENSIEALNNNDPSLALDEYLWTIDNNWYAYDFSKETYEYFTDYVLYQNEDKLMWGTNRVLGHNDLYDVIQSLMSKDENSDFSEELTILNNCLNNEKVLLNDEVNLELEGLDILINNLQQICE